MLQENISKEAPRLNKKISHRLPNIRRRILHSKRGILPSLMPNEHSGDNDLLRPKPRPMLGPSSPQGIFSTALP